MEWLSEECQLMRMTQLTAKEAKGTSTVRAFPHDVFRVGLGLIRCDRTCKVRQPSIDAYSYLYSEQPCAAA